jgi:proteasome lid subunit RPN8/RPN11
VNQIVRIAADVLAVMSAHARGTPAEECCGLLAGRDGRITDIHPATNVAPEPAKSYEIAPKEIFKLIRKIRTAGLELLGIYHSHPTGENAPSPRDVELAYYPEAAYFILSPRPGVAKPVRAFSIRDGRTEELEIRIE